MSLVRTLSRNTLIAALVLPALAYARFIEHNFDVPKLLTLTPLALAALALAWSLPEARPPRPSRWALGLSLLWALSAAWLALVPLHPRLGFGLGFNATAAWSVDLRIGYMLVGLGLAFMALRADAAVALPPALRRLALALAALWCLSASLSLRPDLGLPVLCGWAGYFLVFSAAWILGGSERERRRLWLALLLAALANSVYGLAQSLDYDPVPWSERFNGRAGGFFGNPNFLGGHLALLLPLALAWALEAPAKSRRIWRWLLAALLAAALAATQTRGAWAAGAAGCGVLVLALWRGQREAFRDRRKALLTAAGLLLAAGLLWLAFSPVARGRLLNTFGSDPESSRRAFLMHKTAQLALRHPLLGVGPGDFRILYPSVQVAGLAPQDYASQPYILSEHGHNDFLQMAADAGWLAALVWAALMAWLMRHFWRACAGPGARPGALSLGALGGLTALLVHGLANFPFLILATQATAWALAALALREIAAAAATAAPGSLPGTVPAALAGPVPAAALAVATALPDTASAPGAGSRRAAVGLGLALAAALFIWRGRSVTADGYWWIGAGEQRLREPDRAVEPLLRATGIDPGEDRIWRIHGQAQFDRGNIWDSIGSLRESLRLNPYDATAALALGKACLENHLVDEARNVLSKAVAYAPNYPELWEPLAAACYQSSHFEEAVTAYDWMLYYHINEEAAFANKAATYGNLGRLPDALATLREAERRFPDSGKVQVNLAITLLKMDQRAQAIEAWRKAARWTPSDPQVDNLRKALRQ